MGKYSQIEDNRVRLAIWRLRQNLMQIVMIGNLSSQKARDDDSYQKQTDRWG